MSKNKTPEPSSHHKKRLKAHYGFVKMPFSKYMWAKNMFDSQGQRELLASLHMWTEVRGVALVSGPSGVGKSITLRRFVSELPNDRFHVVDFTYLPSTVYGFLRSLGRQLGVTTSRYAADQFDAVKAHLSAWQDEHGTHPIVIIDDAEGLPVAVLDTIRRLTAYDLDAEDRFSVLISGTEDIVGRLRHPALVPLKSRITYAQTLRTFGMEDTRNYVVHQLRRADADAGLLSDGAVQTLFQASKGTARSINQLAMQALIAGAATGVDKLDQRFMARLIREHPLYQSAG